MDINKEKQSLVFSDILFHYMNFLKKSMQKNKSSWWWYFIEILF